MRIDSLPAPAMVNPTVQRRSITLKIEQGLHIRACSRVVAIVGKYEGNVVIENGDRKADARSMFDLLQLAAHPETMLIVEATGDGAAEILDQLEAYFSNAAES